MKQEDLIDDNQIVNGTGKGVDEVLKVLEDAYALGKQYWVPKSVFKTECNIGDMRIGDILKKLVAKGIAESKTMGNRKLFRLIPKSS